jgi:hypothetical protein
LCPTLADSPLTDTPEFAAPPSAPYRGRSADTARVRSDLEMARNWLRR